MEGDEIKNPWHYSAEKLIEHYKIPELILKVALSNAEKESTIRERLLMTICSLNQFNNDYPRKYFEMEINLYKKLIDYSYKRENAALQVLKYY